MSDFPKRVVLGEGYPWALGLEPYDAVALCRNHGALQLPMSAGFKRLRWNKSLWRKDVPRYRLVLERVEEMSDILTPEEVDELRPANEPKHLMMGTNTWRLIQTLDALAEALRAAESQIAFDARELNREPTHRYYTACARVAAWLEADDE